MAEVVKQPKPKGTLKDADASIWTYNLPPLLFVASPVLEDTVPESNVIVSCY